MYLKLFYKYLLPSLPPFLFNIVCLTSTHSLKDQKKCKKLELFIHPLLVTIVVYICLFSQSPQDTQALQTTLRNLGYYSHVHWYILNLAWLVSPMPPETHSKIVSFLKLCLEYLHLLTLALPKFDCFSPCLIYHMVQSMACVSPVVLLLFFDHCSW